MKVTYFEKDKDWQENRIPQRHGKSVCITRYGAFGDMIQLTTLLPWFKDNGYHICINTTPVGLTILRNNPHIDEFLVQENDWVPNEELGAFWHHVSRSFEKHVNLSESVEGSLLAVPGRKSYNWAKEFRHLIMNVNYLEGQHAIAGIPIDNPRTQYHQSGKEKKWAKDYRARLGKKNFVIMWSIAGSSVHKISPWVDHVMARLLYLYKDIRIILVGDEVSQIGEIGWEKEPRVIRKSGRWPIRECLAMALECDLVIGPETGVMNAVAFEPMAKVLMLSHSSKENIGKHWVNTDILEPSCECYPCHKLHYDRTTCNTNKITGVSECATSISVDQIFDAINNRMPNKIEPPKEVAA